MAEEQEPLLTKVVRSSPLAGAIGALGVVAEESGAVDAASEIFFGRKLYDHESIMLNAAFNSMLPEYADSDSMYLNDRVSPELVAIMRKVADHYYKTPAITEKHISNAETELQKKNLRAGLITYDMVNDLFKTSSYYGTRNYDGLHTDLKLILGNFHLKKDPETGWYRSADGSYSGSDIYDFANNAEFIKQFAPEVTETLLDMDVPRETIFALYDYSASQLVAGIGATALQGGKLHSAARMFGGVFMSDQVSPEKGGGQFIKFDIPATDEVAFERPAPRPLWFEDENIEPVMPNSPMDEERKGLLDSFLANFDDIFVTEAEAGEESTDAVLPISKPSPQTQQATPDLMSEDTTPAPASPKQTAKPKQMELPVSPPDRKTEETMSFNEAFASNRAAGKETFIWRGNEYTTEIA